MNDRRTGVALRLLAASASLLFFASSLDALPARQVAVDLTQDAARMIQENRLQEAIEVLDRAIEADQEYWEAFYQKGRALGLMSRWQESRDALLQATGLNPGHGHSHRLAAIAAINLEDWEIAWDQAIRAQLAGEDMVPTLLGMYEKSQPPDDFEIRINAATIFVADVDTSPATAEIDLPTNFNPQVDMGSRQGRASDLEDSAVNQSSLDLIRLQRTMRRSLAESPRLAVVLDPGRAKYIVSVQLEEVTRTQPVAARGYFRVIDVAAREIVYRQPIDIANLASTPEIVGKLRRYVTDFAAWLAAQEGGG